MSERGASSSKSVTPPEPLRPTHDIAAFDCGNAILNDWLKRRALTTEESGASRTYVVCAGGRVVGYYALANGSVALVSATGRMRRNMPDPIPVMVLGRLAVDRAWQDQHVGRGLLRDAILRTLQAAAIAGIRTILVHAISAEAKAFYERAGFAASPLEPMTLMISVRDATRALE